MEGTLREHLAALVHHVELSKAGWRTEALEAMVLAVSFEADQSLSLDDLTDRLNDQIDAPVALAQVSSIVERLVSKPRLLRNSDGTLKLTEACRVELEENFDEDLVFLGDAQKSFEAIFADLPAGSRPAWDDFLQDFLNPLVSELGARTYQVISGEADAPSESATYRDFLNRYPKELRPDISAGISQLMKPRNPAIRRLVLTRLNATLLVQATGLSEEALEALRSSASRRLEMDVFADTNFLFSLLGLHDNPADDVVDALEQLLRLSGGQTAVQLYVLPITLDEARETLGRYKDRLAGIVFDKNLARAVTRGSFELSGITLKYIQEGLNARSPIGADEYFEPYLSNLVEVCRSKGVELYNTDLEALRTDQDVLDDLVAERERQAKYRGKGKKPYQTVLHDMVLWHFTRRKRPAVVDSPADAKHWVASIDFGFLAFDRMKQRATGRSFPVVIHPTVLLQLLQFWVPRSEELEVALIDSLQPLLPHEFDADSERVTLKILKVLSRFEELGDLSEETMTRILIDDATRSRIAETEDVEEQINLVESAVIAQAKELQERAESLAQKKRELEHSLESAESAVTDTRSALAKVEDRLEAKEKESRELAERVEELEQREDQRRVQIERRRQRAYFAVFSFAVTVGCVWLSSAVIVPEVVIPTLRSVGVGMVHSTVTSLLGLLFGIGVGLGIADVLGTRVESVRHWHVYERLRSFHIWLWGTLVASILIGLLPGTMGG